MNHPILSLRQYEDKIELYCNCFNYGYHSIEYYSRTNSSAKIVRDIETAEVTIENLDKDIYVFRGRGENGYTPPLIVNILGDTKSEYLNNLFPDIYEEYHNQIFNKLQTNYYLEEIYKAYLNNKNADLTNIYLDIIKTLIQDYNNKHNWMNNSDNLDIKLNNSFCIEIKLSDELYTQDTSIIIEQVKYDSEYISTEEENENKLFGYLNINYIPNIKNSYKFNLNEEGLYRIKFITDGCVYRSYYLYIPDNETKTALYTETIENLNKIAAAEQDTSYFLSSEYQFESEEEKEIILAMEYRTDLKALLPRPNLTYKDKIITLDISNYYDLLKTMNKNFYLAAFEKDSLYLNNSAPRKILIDSPVISFNKDNYYFNRERYYFFILSEENIRLSGITTLDLSLNNDNGIDYNDKYQRILWNRYVKNLHKCLENNPKWGDVKNILDRYLFDSNVAFIELDQYVEEQVLQLFNYKYDNTESIIYGIEFNKLKYYSNKDRNFMNEQLYKVLYGTHVIPNGNYVLEIKRINGKKITKEYIYQSDQSLEIKINDDDYIILRCIRLSDYKVSDFVMYNNTGYGTVRRFNSIGVSIQNGL